MLRVAPPRSKRYIGAGASSGTEIHMRAETQAIVEEIKQSVGLLRRHL